MRFLALLMCVMFGLSACAFSGNKPVNYYKGGSNLPSYKQGPDGRYYPVDAQGNLLPMTYDYRPDLRNLARAQQSAGLPPPQQQPRGQYSQQQGVAPQQQYAPQQQGYAPQQRYAPQQQYIPQQQYAQPYPPQPQQGYPPQGYYYAPQGQQQPQIAAPQLPPGQKAAPKFILPSGSFEDNDAAYEIVEDPDANLGVDIEQYAPVPPMRQVQRQAVPQQLVPQRPMPDISQFYKQFTTDADSAYIPPTNIEQYGGDGGLLSARF
jgi:hypothetical protein